MSSCSGVIVSETERNQYVLTAKHCIDIFEEVYVDHNKAKLYLASTSDDLALIIVNGKIPGKVPIKFSAVPTYIGAEVHHIGFPTGYPSLTPYLSTGVVSRISNDWNFALLEIVLGCSGGGVFDEDGNLIGILWGSYDTYNNKITIFEPLEDITKFLNEINNIGK